MNYATANLKTPVYSANNMEMPNMVKTADSNVVTCDKFNLKKSLIEAAASAKNYYETSTKMLYQVLGQCFEIYYNIETASTEDREVLKKELELAYAKLKSSQRSNKIPTRIVSVVFNLPEIERKTRSRYARVLAKAFNEKNKPTNTDEFINWILAQGGIVKALEAKQSGDQTTLTQADINQIIRNQPVMTTISGIPNKGNRFVVLLADASDANSVNVLYAFDDEEYCEGVVRRAQKAIAKKSKERNANKKSAEEVTEAVIQEATA